MSFPRYPKYKDSGLEWLGQVPDHWEVGPVKRFFKVLDGLRVPLSTEERSYRQGNFPYYGASGIIDYVDDFIFDEDMVLVSEDGANLLARATPIAFVAKGRYWVNNHAHILKAPDDALTFWSERIESIDLTPVVTGAAQPKLTIDALANLVIAVPPTHDERKKIARFVEAEVTRIDALVAEQEQLITLLKEKRQAVISHAVTKGLDPSVPMKDSGVEWLGEVPAHWEVKALKFVATVQTGVAKGKDNTGKETVVVPYLRVANVQDGYLALEDMAEIEIPSSDLPRYLLRSGDVLMNEGGDFDKLGRGHVWRAEIEPCIHQNHVFAVRPHSVAPEWLNTVTSSSYAQFYFMSRSKQSTNLASISSTSIMELPVVLPPPSEQEQLLAFLERSTAQLKSLIEEAVLSIELMRERRSALISAAVTGQIDVRSLESAHAA